MTGLWPTVLRVRRPGDRPDVVLRALRSRDRDEWERLRRTNVDWLAPWEAQNPHPGRPLRFGRLVRHYDAEARAGRAQPFVVEVEGALVGQMHLTQIVWGSSGTAHVGYWIDRRRTGLGLAPTALAAAVDHAFLGLGLHRVVASVHPDNAPSIAVMRKLGFREEGVQRRSLYVAGAWRDHLAFALTTEDLAGECAVRLWNRADAAARGLPG